MEGSKRYETEWVLVVLVEYVILQHTRLSKVHVSGYVSNIYTRLVKDRMSYALHNGRGLIIMQMRTKVGN